MARTYEAVLDGDGNGGIRVVAIENGRRRPVLTIHGTEPNGAGAHANALRIVEDAEEIDAAVVAALEGRPAPAPVYYAFNAAGRRVRVTIPESGE